MEGPGDRRIWSRAFKFVSSIHDLVHHTFQFSLSLRNQGPDREVIMIKPTSPPTSRCHCNYVPYRGRQTHRDVY
jgi:hypothetical protein